MMRQLRYGALWLIAAGLPAVAQAELQPPVPIVGGYSDVAVSDAGVRAAARFAAASLRPRAGLRSIDSASRQVVQGMNYRIDLTTTNNRRWRVIVYQPLRGRMRLISRQALGPARRR